MNSKLIPAVIFCLVLMHASAQVTGKVRTWTNKSGQSMEAAFVSVKEGKVKFQKKDGSTFEYKLDDLSAGDQALIAQNQPAAPPAGKVLDFMGASVAGDRIVICMDVSQTFKRRVLGGTQTQLETAFKSLVQSLPEAVRLNVIYYHQTAEKFRPEPEPMNAANKEAVLAHGHRYFSAGGNPNGRNRVDQFGKGGKDPDGIAYTAVGPEDFEATKTTGGGSRCDVALLAALADQPSTIILMADAFPAVRSYPNGPQGADVEVTMPKVQNYIQQAWSGAARRPRIQIIIPPAAAGKPLDAKAAAWQRAELRAFNGLAAMSGGKVIQLK